MSSSLSLKSTWRSNYSCCVAGVVPMAAIAAAATMTLVSISCIRMAASWNIPASIQTPTSSRWKENSNNNQVGPRRGRNTFLSTTTGWNHHSNFETATSTTTTTNNFTTTLCEGCADATNHQDPKNDDENDNRRSRNTLADRYFSEHGELPKPKVMHAVITAITETNQDSDEENHHNPHRPRGMLVIGDVHGCFDEMHLLYQKALQVNHHIPFQYVILVGDLCNKGPDSAKVVRWVRRHQLGDGDVSTRWLTVRGNHDDGALAAALGDEERRQKKKYQWVKDGEGIEANDEATTSATRDDASKITLSDDDVEWLSELPYTITIPGSLLGESFDTVIVHAGFIPRVELFQQTIETMITIREVEPLYDETNEHHDIVGYQYHERDAKPKKKKKKKHKKDKKHPSKHHDDDEDDDGDEDQDVPRAWAQVWKGPPRVIFGHDARRGLQQQDWAVGLDTGAVYGKQLTGMILPDQTLVSVDAVKTHSPVASAGT